MLQVGENAGGEVEGDAVVSGDTGAVADGIEEMSSTP